MGYDDFGNQNYLWDKDAQENHYTYDDYGQLTDQIDANNNHYKFQYDILGRITDKDLVSGVGSENYSYAYRTTGNGINQLQQQIITIDGNSNSKSYSYDEFQRLSLVSETEDGQSFTTTFQYDAFGRPINTTYPGGFTVSNTYDFQGFLTDITNGNNSIWHGNSMNNLGQYESYTKGNITTNNSFNNLGLPNQLNSGFVQNLQVEIDPTNGNLKSRTDVLKNLSENFMPYDNLDRLKYLNGQELVKYNSNGTILSKNDAGAYDDYSATHLDGVSVISGAQDISPLPQIISYTAFNKISSISEAGNNLEFKYGPEQQRVKTILKNGTNTIYTKYFAGNFEKLEMNGHTYEVTYISSPTGLCAIHVKDGSLEKTYFVYTDHLGSILKTTDDNGNTIAEQSFDAWGNYRDPVTGQKLIGRPANLPDWLFRGYTGHEHLPEFKLINMNGRCYDPVLGAMLSPDNEVSDLGLTQSYNRYSYVLNNPLKYTDPEGEWVNLVIGALIGGYSGWQIGQAAGADGWNMAGYIFAGAGIGAFTSGVATQLSSMGFGPGFTGMVAGGVGAAGFKGLGNNWKAGEMLEAGVNGSLSGWIGALGGAAIGGGAGAFFGGGLGSAINTSLNGGNSEAQSKSFLAGATMALGIYHLSSYLNWEFAGGNKWGPIDVSYKQYITMQADFQRSRFWNKEYGGDFIGQSVKRSPKSARHSLAVDIYLQKGSRGFYHTHWAPPGAKYEVDANSDIVDRATVPLGTRVQVTKETALRYHSPADMNPSSVVSPSIVINRYDASWWLYGMSNYNIINPPLNRFVWSFFPWR